MVEELGHHPQPSGVKKKPGMLLDIYTDICNIQIKTQALV